MNYFWLLRMARWVRRPPSATQVKIVLGVIVLALILVGIERFVGWPDWLTLPGGARPQRIPRF
tara:strand:- start:51 stop:239 length:189 start_codon:yes stop_codon:yes gene_type:complete